MTDPLFKPVLAGEVVRLPTAADQQHKFGAEVRRPFDPLRDRRQIERTCELCGVVKITVQGPDNRFWREWRTTDGKQFEGPTPRCEVVPQ